MNKFVKVLLYLLIIPAVLFGISFVLSIILQSGTSGEFWQGLPFHYSVYTSCPSCGTTYNYLNLILDIISYYAFSGIIYYLVQKVKNK